jgi:hypothetical protein
MIETKLGSEMEVTVLWNGGWDTYAVDPRNVRLLTQTELAADRGTNDKYFPTLTDSEGMWLKCKFVKARHGELRMGDDWQCVRILRHIGSGE